MSESEPKKKRGPKPTYPKYRPTQDGAPLLATRVSPEVYEWARSRPEGTRPYLERIILEDKGRTSPPAAVMSAGDDVPGQLLLNGSSSPPGPVTEAKPKKASKRGKSSTEQETQ